MTLAKSIAVGLHYDFFFIINNMCDINANAGNSIRGPIIRAKAMIGSSGKKATAIAREIGEFLAKVVRLRNSIFIIKF